MCFGWKVIRYNSIIMIVMCYSYVRDRVFTDNQARWSLLSKYAKTATCNQELRDFLDSDVDELVTMLNSFCPALEKLLIHFDKIVPYPSACSELLTALSSCSPICSLFCLHQLSFSLCRVYVWVWKSASYPVNGNCFMKNVPILYQLICNHNETSLPPEYRDVVNEMLLKAQLRTEKHSLIPVSVSAIENSYEYFPSLEKSCSRQTYVSDKRREKYLCSKAYKGHPSLLPGVFTLFCPHG